MGINKVTDAQPRVYFDCSKCLAYCCSIYDRVVVTKRDLNRLAKYFGLTVEETTRRYTKPYRSERVLRRKKDVIFPKACQFLDPETRGCGIYHARPSICREYPGLSRCSYYDVLQFEREQQDDPNVMPLVQITFRNMKTTVTSNGNGNGNGNGTKRVLRKASTEEG